MSQINFANTQFAKFVNYANSLPNASESKAIVAAASVNAGDPKALADRAIVPKTGDYVGKIFRNKTLKNASDDELGDKIPDFNITEIKQEVV